MNSMQWWNGRWSRLVRRDVFLRNGSPGRWEVDLRRGGPEGRLRTRTFESREDAVAWVERTVVDPEAGWREVSTTAKARRRAKSARNAGMAT